MIAEVTSTNWETHTLVQALAEHLGVHPRRIAFAGTKDRRAVSVQLMSFDGVDGQGLSSLRLKDVTVKPLFQSTAPLHLGQLIGNRFSITLRNCDSAEGIHGLFSPLEALGGFPNLFGIQRFGAVRSITHLVGKHLTRGEFEAAVMTYIAHPIQGENEQTFKLRQDLEQTRDFAAAYQHYPKSLNFERLILERLSKNPTDFIDAIQALPKNLMLMFVSAYQSYLFNRILSERIRRKLPLNQAIPGDLVAVIKDGRLTDEIVPVSAANCMKVNQQIQRKKAAVTGVLLGSDSIHGSGEMGEIESRIFEQEKVEARAFIVPEIPFLSSSGSRRMLLAPLKDLVWSAAGDDLNPGKAAVHVTFELTKGCYATSFLRELMKAPSAKDY